MAEQIPQTDDRDAKILAAHAEFTSRLRGARQEVVRNAYDNALHYLGYQWQKFDPATRGFRNLYLKKATPQPVTNKIFPIVNSIHSGLCRVDPALAFRPGSDKDEDRLTAELAQEILSYVQRATHAADVDLRLSKAVCLYNNAYKVTGYDADGGPLDWVAHWTCPNHPEQSYPPDQVQQMGGVCPEDQQPLVESETEGETVARGALYTELATPFELWVDYTIPLMRDQPKAMFRRMRACEWAYARWPHLKAKLGKDGAPQDTGMTYLQSLLRLTPGAGSLGFSGATKFENAVLVDDFHILPDENFPKGCLARIGNGAVVLDAVDYPYHDGRNGRRGRPFLPIAHYFADDCVPAHIATGPIDHLKEPQRRRNRLQARVEQIVARMANPVWFIPEGMDIPTPSGEAGQVIRGNTLASGGAEPKRIDGSRVGGDLFTQVQQIDEEMQDIAGTYEIGQGDRPKNVEGGYAMQILQNAAKGRQAPLYRRWEQSHAESARHQFLIFRLFAPESIYFQIKGEESRWRVKQIQRADLDGGIDIDVEPGSGLPQSLLEKRAGVEQAIGSGLVDIQNPMERLKCLRSMGVVELISNQDAEDDHVAWEHDQVIAYAKANFDAQGNPLDPSGNVQPFTVLPDLDLDPHDFHFARHLPWMRSDEFKALAPAVQQIFRNGHQMQHLMKIQEAAMQQQAATEPPPSKGGKAPPAANQSEGGARKNERGAGHTGRELRRASEGEQAA